VLIRYGLDGKANYVVIIVMLHCAVLWLLGQDKRREKSSGQRQKSAVVEDNDNIEEQGEGHKRGKFDTKGQQSAKGDRFFQNLVPSFVQRKS
jgi:lipopolysaccharide export system protein LptC